jgi:hypothetical protein
MEGTKKQMLICQQQIFVTECIENSLQFTLASISSEQTKFCCVISQLDHQYAVEVEDIITSPPERDTHTTLKT